MNLLAPCKTSDSFGAERGVSILEFALILPILTLLTLGVLELVHATNVTKVAAQFSREAANVAFRECTGITDTVALTECLATYREDVREFAQQSGIPGMEITVSLYRTSAGATPTLTRQATVTSPSFVSRFSATPTPVGFAPEILALPEQSIYVAEVYIPYTAVIPRLPLFSFNITSIYDSTVL